MASCLTMDTSFLPVMANTIDHVHMNTFDKRHIIKKNWMFCAWNHPANEC